MSPGTIRICAVFPPLFIVSTNPNPINFDYFPVETGNTEVQTTYDGFLQPQSGFVPGDFDGDGYLDFYNEGKIYTKLFQGGTANAINAQSLFGIYPIQTLSLDNKLNHLFCRMIKKHCMIDFLF